MLRTVKQIKKAIDKENKKNKRVDGVGKVKIGKPNGQSLTFGEFLTALKNKNVGTNKIFRKRLEDAWGYEGGSFVWECSPINQETLDNDFSFMVYKPGDLLEEFEPQPEVYQKYYDKELTKSVVSFPSLSKNLLVVPKPSGDKNYQDLSRFVKNASEVEWVDFWAEVAEQMLAKLAANPKVPYYLSTSGLQVSWLHVRIEENPLWYFSDEGVFFFWKNNLRELRNVWKEYVLHGTPFIKDGKNEEEYWAAVEKKIFKDCGAQFAVSLLKDSSWVAADNELFFDNTDPSPEVKEKVERLSQMGKKTDKVVERIKKRIENEEDSSRPTFWGTPLEGMTYEKVNACFKRNQKISEDKFNVVAKNPLSVLLYHPEKNLELAREHLDLNHERLLDKLDNLKRKDMDEGAVLEPEKKINFADYSSGIWTFKSNFSLGDFKKLTDLSSEEEVGNKKALIKDTFNTIRYTNWEQVKKYAELELLKKDIKLEEFTKIFSENQIEESSLTGKFKNLWDLNRLFNCEKKGSDINCVAEVIEKDGDLVLTSLHSGQILRKLYDEEKFPVGERVIDWNAAIPQNGVLYRLLYNNLTELKKLAKQKGLKLSEAETEKDTNHTPTFAEHTSEEKIELAAESVKEFAKWARELLTITRITEAELNGGIEDKMEEDFDSLDGSWEKGSGVYSWKNFTTTTTTTGKESREREAADLIKVTEYLLNKKRNYVLECTEKKGNLIQFRVIESTDRNEEEMWMTFQTSAFSREELEKIFENHVYKLSFLGRFDKAERKIINILNSEGDPTEIELNDISPADWDEWVKVSKWVFKEENLDWVKEWTDNGFNPLQAQAWVDISASAFPLNKAAYQPSFYAWLRDVKNKISENLSKEELPDLKTEFGNSKKVTGSQSYLLRWKGRRKVDGMNYESFTVIETENGKEKKQLKLWSTFFTDAEKDLLENNICQLETPGNFVSNFSSHDWIIQGIDNGGFQLKALTEREIKEKFIKNIKDRFSGAFSSENDAILGENGKLNKLGNGAESHWTGHWENYINNSPEGNLEELLGRRGSVLLCLARSIIGTVHAKVLDKTTEKTLKSELKEYLENYIANHTNGSETIIYNDTGDIYGNYAKMIKEIRKQALITKKQKKDLEEVFSATEKCDAWTTFLDNLKKQPATEWLETDEKAVEYLVRLDQKGYSPTEDAKKLTFLRNEDTGEVSVDYITDQGHLYSAFEWKKDNADFYSNNLEEKVQKLTTQLTDPTDQTRWKEIIGLYEDGKDLTAEETIRRFIKEKEKSDLNAALSTEIEEVIIREQVIHSPAVGSWNNTLIPKETRVNIFYAQQPESAEYILHSDKEVEATRNVLETIQEILAINKNDETAWQKLTFEKLTTLEIDKSVKLEILINSKTNDLLSKAEERVKVIKKFITDISLSTVRTEFHYYNSLKEELARGDGGFDIWAWKDVCGGAENAQAKINEQVERLAAWKILAINEAESLSWINHSFWDKPEELEKEENKEIKAEVFEKLTQYEAQWDWVCEKMGGGDGTKTNDYKEKLNKLRETPEKLNEEGENEIAERERNYYQTSLIFYLQLGEDENNQNETKLEAWVAAIEEFSKAKENTIKWTIWEEYKNDIVENTFTNDTDTEDDIDEDRQLGTESRLDSIQKKLAYIKGIPELAEVFKYNCKKNVWTTEEFEDFERELAEFPLNEKKEDLDFKEWHAAYSKVVPNWREIWGLNSLEEEIKKQVAEYKAIGERFKEIDENEEYLDDEATADTSLTRLEKLEIDLNYLLDLIPEVSETPAKSLSGQPLTPAKKQFYTQNEESVDYLRLVSLKIKYINTKINTITEFEKDYIENKVNSIDYLRGMEDDFKNWNYVLSVVADNGSIDEERKTLRNLWQTFSYESNKVPNFKDLINLVNRNWDQYFTENAKLEELKTETRHNEEHDLDEKYVIFEMKEFVEGDLKWGKEFNLLNTDYLVLKEALTLLNNIKTAELTNEITITDQVKEINEREFIPDNLKTEITEKWAEKLAELKAEETKKSIRAKIKEAEENTNSGQLETLLKKLIDFDEIESEQERKVLTDDEYLQDELTDAIKDLRDKIGPWNDFFTEHLIVDKKSWYTAFPAINAADAGNGEDKVHSLYAGDLVFNLKDYENEAVENEERIEFANLEATEQNKINDAKTPEEIRKARKEIIENRQNIRQEEIALVQEISEVLAKKETIGGEEELLSLLNEIEEYKSWGEVGAERKKQNAFGVMKEKITETVGEVEKQIRNIREAKRREAENTFIADFESTLRKSDRKGIDGDYDDWEVPRPSREEILAYNIFLDNDNKLMNGIVMGVLHLSGWQCDRSQIENLTPADEGDGHLTSDKEPAEIAEGYLYYHDNSFCVNYRGIIEHSAVNWSKKELDFLNQLVHLRNETTGEKLPGNWETYQDWKTRAERLNAEQVHGIIGRGWKNGDFARNSTAEGEWLTINEYEGKKYNVLTEEKGVMEARMDAKNKEGITEAEKAIFDHAVLDSVEAINAAQALLTKIKEYAKDIKATTASEAKAAIDFLGNYYYNGDKDPTKIEEKAWVAVNSVGNLATNERNRLTELEDLHKARIEAIEKDADGGEWELSPNELKLFASSYADEDGEKVPLEGHQLAEINTVYRVRAVHKTLTLLRSFINFSFDEYTSIENLKDLSNLTFNIIDEIKNKLDDECAEIKIGEEYVFAFDLIDKIVDGKVNQLNEDVRNLWEWFRFFTKHQILGENETLNNENAMGWYNDVVFEGKTGVAEAELVYQEALKNPLSGYPYSSIQFTLEDRNKIFHTKTRADIPKAQQEVSWDQFFRDREIINVAEQNAWKVDSGLNVAEAIIAYDTNHWTQLIHHNINEIGDKKAKISPHGITSEEVSLVEHDWEEMVKFHKVWREIEKANKFSDLPELDKESVKLEFDETKTVRNWDWIIAELKEKDFQFYQKGFEGTEDADASGLTRIEKEDWYEAETGLAKDGATERIAFNHGWKEPTQIREGETDYKIYDLEITSDIIEQETIKVKVLEVGKAELDQVKDLIEWVKDNKELDFDTELTAQLDNLNYAKLPGGYKRTDLEKFANDWKNRLLDNDFIDEFIGQAGEARTFANNPANRAAVLAYRKTGASFLTGAEAGTIYNKGWKNPDLIEISELGWIIVRHDGEIFHPLETSLDQAEKELWITDFGRRSITRTFTDEDEIWAYSKNGKVSVNIAFQVFQNHWLADEFNFDSSNRALIPSYSSYGEPADRNLDATLTDKQQLDKINEIIKRIKTASRSTDLPTEEEINDYDDSKVVNISGKRIKPRAIVKARRQEAKTRLEQNEANKLARTAAIQAIQRYWNSLSMSGDIKRVCGNDWENNFNRKSGTEISDYANQLKDQIAHAKVQPDINEITNKLNASPAVSLNLNYVAEMINLADKDTDRARKKAEIMTQIEHLRQAKIAQLETERKQQEEAEKQRQAEEAKQQKISQLKTLITSAKAILEKMGASQAEVEQAISSLKTLTTATSDSVETQVWTENKTVNEKLLADLNTKLVRFDLPPPPTPAPEQPKPTPPPFPVNENWRSLVEEVQQTLQAEQQATKTEVQTDLQAAQSPQATVADQVKAIKNLGKIDGEEDLAEEKTQLESVAETLFIQDRLECLKGFIGAIEENLKKNNLTTEELTDKTNQDIKDIKDIKDKLEVIHQSVGIFVR